MILTMGAALLAGACVSRGPGSDFDKDGLKDSIEDKNANLAFDAGETDFTRTDTDGDGLCDGRPDTDLPTCNGCEDCNNNGFWEPCLNETDPLNDDTDNDGLRDGEDPAPLDHLKIDCSRGNVKLPYGASLPPGKPYPAPQTPSPSPMPPPRATPTPKR